MDLCECSNQLYIYILNDILKDDHPHECINEVTLLEEFDSNIDHTGEK